VSTKLVASLEACLGTAFCLYTKAHAFHWNVTGASFPQLHEMFGRLYADLHTAVDDIAEHIRALDSFPPSGTKALYDLSAVEDDNGTKASGDMLRQLVKDVEAFLEVLRSAEEQAEEDEACGVENFLQGIIDAFEKWRWMLKATASKAA